MKRKNSAGVGRDNKHGRENKTSPRTQVIISC